MTSRVVKSSSRFPKAQVMPSKSSAIRFFNTKALIPIALLACLLSSVAAANSTHEGVAMGTLNAPVLSKRYLRSSAEKTTTGHAYNFEERLITLPKRAVELTIGSRLKVLRWRLLQKTPTDVFKSLKLGDITVENLFKSSRFARGVAFVLSKKPESQQTAFKCMLLELVSHYREDALVKALVKEVENDVWGSVAFELLEACIRRWKSAEKSEQEVFKLFMLKKNDSFKSPVFYLWLKYVTLLGKGNNDIYQTFKTMFGSFQTVKMLDEAIRNNASETMKRLAQELQEEQFMDWLRHDVPPRVISKLFARSSGFSYALFKKTVNAYYKFDKKMRSSEAA